MSSQPRQPQRLACEARSGHSEDKYGGQVYCRFVVSPLRTSLLSHTLFTASVEVDAFTSWWALGGRPTEARITQKGKRYVEAMRLGYPPSSLMHIY